MQTCKILNVNIASVDLNRLIAYTERHLEQLRGEYFCAANVHTVVTAYENGTYMRAYEHAALIIPDGGPLSTEGNRRGYPDMKRTPGPDYMTAMLERGAYRHFFYGSTEDTLTKMETVIAKRYPEAVIAGAVSPPFRKLTKEEDSAYTEQINAAHPDFIWVGLGAPKQELWMYRHRKRVNGLMVGVGASFDYLAGKIRRAPEWMQRHNLEWAYRLRQEPKRLFRRYLSTNTKFLWNAVVCGK